MCGIAGVYYFKGLNPGSADDESVLAAIRHRGPDHQSYLSTGPCTLYHTRLSIVDVSPRSHQPYREKGSAGTLVYNGEIFNYRDLQPNAHGDVEVLYRLLEQEGEAGLHKLNGFFAFAFHKDGQLLLARDRFGLKPLYYYQDKEKFAFASELGALLRLAGKQALNPSQLYTYFRLNYCSGPESIFQDIRRLEPGSLLKVNSSGSEKQIWYTPRPAKTQNNLFDLLDDAVRIRLHADVPVGCFLSGGVDSSIISALALRHKKDLHTFSLGFKNERYFDETAWAEKVAKHIGSSHETFRLTEDDFLNNIESFLSSVDEPFADSSAFNFYMLSKFTASRVKVALSGDGSDELFKGYYKHRAMLMKGSALVQGLSRIAGLLSRLSSTSRKTKAGNLFRQIRKFDSIKQLSDLEAFRALASISSDDEVRHLLKTYDPDYFNRLLSFTDEEIENGIADLRIVLADDMLVKADRFSMRHGLEVRNPFLDYRVAEHALALTTKEKISLREQKIALRKTFAALLPADVFSRRKKGFELPLQKWLGGSLSEKIRHEILNEEKIRTQNILNYEAVRVLQQRITTADAADSAAQLWAVLVFQSWYDRHLAYISHA